MQSAAKKISASQGLLNSALKRNLGHIEELIYTRNKTAGSKTDSHEQFTLSFRPKEESITVNRNELNIDASFFGRTDLPPRIELTNTGNF